MVNVDLRLGFVRGERVGVIAQTADTDASLTDPVVHASRISLGKADHVNMSHPSVAPFSLTFGPAHQLNTGKAFRNSKLHYFLQDRSQNSATNQASSLNTSLIHNKKPSNGVELQRISCKPPLHIAGGYLISLCGVRRTQPPPTFRRRRSLAPVVFPPTHASNSGVRSQTQCFSASCLFVAGDDAPR